VLAGVGGFEIGVLAGVILGSAGARIPIVLDGFITGAATLLAASLAPGVAQRAIAGHRSVEPGHAVVLERLGLRPLLELDLRLGEGTGGALAMSLIDAAVAIRDGMATFDAAGVAGPASAAERVP
jgi:nicotinate-nucleotide--dimethylbenzimidazole phosphoribosyltransferase